MGGDEGSSTALDAAAAPSGQGDATPSGGLTAILAAMQLNTLLRSSFAPASGQCCRSCLPRVHAERAPLPLLSAGAGSAAHKMCAAVSNAAAVAAANVVPQQGGPSPTGAWGPSGGWAMPGARAAPTGARPQCLCCTLHRALLACAEPAGSSSLAWRSAHSEIAALW